MQYGDRSFRYVFWGDSLLVMACPKQLPLWSKDAPWNLARRVRTGTAISLAELHFQETKMHVQPEAASVGIVGQDRKDASDGGNCALTVDVTVFQNDVLALAN